MRPLSLLPLKRSLELTAYQARAYSSRDGRLSLYVSIMPQPVEDFSHTEKPRHVSIFQYSEREKLSTNHCWNIFQNDLSYCVTANLSMYANDHQMYHTGRDQSSVTSKHRDSARTDTKWKDSNLLAGNLKKY